jgi:hypothetical protein
MATDVRTVEAESASTPTQAGHAAGPRIYRLTVRQFEKMIDAGVFRDGARVELLGGVLITQMTRNDPHDFAIGQFGDLSRRFLPDGFFVREEKSLRIGQWSRPEPDFAIVRGRRGDFRNRPPQPADTVLLIEVADSTYLKDRGDKWRRYAAGGLPVYWITNLPERRIEVYTDPAGRGRAAIYRHCVLYTEDLEVPIVIDGRELGRIAVKDVLP